MRSALALLVLALLAGPAAAQEADSYEVRQVQRALAAHGLTPDLAPDGKAIEAVHIVRYEVFVEDEPFPVFLNAFHWLTVENVVRRELLLRPGDAWDADRLLESARNLRALRIFSVVAALPVQAKTPGKVDLLLVTRDLWSLRLEWNLQFTDAQIDQLLVQLTERNLFGRNKLVLGRLLVLPLTWSVGEAYIDRRLVGEPLHLEQSADVFFRREDDAFDGFTTRLELARPFYDLDQAYGFRLQAQIQDRVFRHYRAGEVLTWDDPETDAEEAIRRVFDTEQLRFSALGRRQFSGAFTHRVALGVGASRLSVEANAETGLPAANAESFSRHVLPRPLTQIYPVVAWAGFARDFRTYEDLSSFGVSEDVQLGPDLSLTVSAPLEALGSTVNAVELFLSAAWASAFAGDGLTEAAVGAEARLEDGAWIDQELLLRGRVASPRLGIGRLVARADWLLRREDTSNSPVTLGGNNGLRGYPSEFFFTFGGSRIRANGEYRTPPLVWHYLHLGAVAFYDAGDVYGEDDAFALRQSVGVGLRGLLPQFNREVFRLDLGVPIDGSGFSVTLSGGTGQAVPLTNREDLQFDSTVGNLYNQP
ncbi:MAG: BamA/TamA family outer membrane protein [Myxococcales bacterium]|nr:BamA/TamA family outer membrane protein [Myxococcales bacterium]